MAMISKTILGPPGTGKTWKIEQLIKENGTEDYLYLTYNRSMAAMARERIRSDKHHVGTLHSVMASLNGIGPFVTRDDEKEFCELYGLSRDSGSADSDTGESDWERFSRYYDMVVNTMRKPYQPVTEKMSMRYLFDKWKNFKKKIGKFDYTDILEIASQNTYYKKFLFIDEAQDLSPLMWKIVDNIDCENRYIVGDPHQSIYGFRGIDVREFVKRIGDYEILGESHRYGDNLRKMSERALAGGKVMKMPYVGLGQTDIDRYTLRSMSQLDGSKAILCRTINLARNIANRLPYAVVPINHDHGYGNGWGKTTFMVASIMRKWPKIDAEEFAWIVEHSPANLWVRGTKARVKREATLFSYDMMKTRMGPQEIIDRLTIADNVKRNAKRMLVENIPTIYCDTIHAAKGLEFDHVMLLLDLPQMIADDMPPEEYRILYVGMTRARKSIQFMDTGFYNGSYYIPGMSKTIYPL
jgi:superfamily I DNA/RNA helicase